MRFLSLTYISDTNDMTTEQSDEWKRAVHKWCPEFRFHPHERNFPVDPNQLLQSAQFVVGECEPKKRGTPKKGEPKRRDRYWFHHAQHIVPENKLLLRMVHKPSISTTKRFQFIQPTDMAAVESECCATASETNTTDPRQNTLCSPRALPKHVYATLTQHADDRYMITYWMMFVKVGKRFVQVEGDTRVSNVGDEKAGGGVVNTTSDADSTGEKQRVLTDCVFRYVNVELKSPSECLGVYFSHSSFNYGQWHTPQDIEFSGGTVGDNIDEGGGIVGAVDALARQPVVYVSLKQHNFYAHPGYTLDLYRDQTALSSSGILSDDGDDGCWSPKVALLDTRVTSTDPIIRNQSDSASHWFGYRASWLAHKWCPSPYNYACMKGVEYSGNMVQTNIVTSALPIAALITVGVLLVLLCVRYIYVRLRGSKVGTKSKNGVGVHSSNFDQNVQILNNLHRTVNER